jgi:hypothetical protein
MFSKVKQVASKKSGRHEALWESLVSRSSVPRTSSSLQARDLRNPMER